MAKLKLVILLPASCLYLVIKLEVSSKPRNACNFDINVNFEFSKGISQLQHRRAPVETLSSRTGEGDGNVCRRRGTKTSTPASTNNTTGTAEASKMAYFRDVQTAPLDSYNPGQK